MDTRSNPDSPKLRPDQAELDARFQELLPHYCYGHLLFNGSRGRQLLQHRVDLAQPLSMQDLKAFNSLNLRTPFAVITAHNPRGVVASAEANDAANAELETYLGMHELWMEVRVDGLSPDGAHREPGHAVLPPRKQAKRLAAQFGQLALYYFDQQGFWLSPVLATGEPVLLNASF